MRAQKDNENPRSYIALAQEYIQRKYGHRASLVKGLAQCLGGTEDTIRRLLTEDVYFRFAVNTAIKNKLIEHLNLRRQKAMSMPVGSTSTFIPGAASRPVQQLQKLPRFGGNSKGQVASAFRMNEFFGDCSLPYNEIYLRKLIHYTDIGFDIAGDPVPSIVGLACELGVSSGVIRKWAREVPEFGEAIDKMYDLQERIILEKSLKNKINTNISRLILSSKLGYTETTQVDNISSDGSGTPSLNIKFVD